ncbi:alpha-L-fucosidase [Mucilaginibacter lappiensis]|uniref:alpha-L-fucosidase n=1 Tax=Mucilaginibacter lappiensis TaxID=354630 RepID=A0ABR6PMR8_9SPHI|nr:alpha-L-fucosidase [Mucilaginibacter lappiensis]MBB6110489.1 alpha-L-fucosidase [Mucilaginibacter lappiensis]SIR38984.1 alpha-L-fucosidase [Mucilaginibacter lappiensis]
MKRRTLIKSLATGISSLYLSKLYGHSLLRSNPTPGIADGPFKPDWGSLAAYQVPDWFRDAKFGIWAHWGPQCQPERGDWYARGMYQEGSDQYKYHIQKYGHPSKFGFKDVINEWKAENWNPSELLGLYKRAGAKYFMALANHHDNFDLYDSKYQSWNATKLGPKKDLVGGWAKAAREHDLTFGVTVHASHPWTWYEVAQRSDKTGPYAGVPYDGKLTKADGAGKWWNGYDPQELYAQNHALSEDSLNDGSMSRHWDWGNGASVPSKAYCDKFLNRTIELIDKYGPELIYFDDSVLPLWPVSDAGLKIAAHMYNTSIKKHGKLQAALFAKMLDEQQRKCMIWDIERGQSNQIEPLPWQTDTCIGGWHYDRRLFDNKGYKSAKTVIHTLVDVVSKNGNLLLNIPVRGDGTIDSEERAIVEGVAAWMQINSEAIYGTRPWKVFGEGPAMESAVPINEQGFNEGKGKPFTADDIRFTTKGQTLYVIAMGWPGEKGSLIKSLATSSPQLKGKKITGVSILGYNDKLNWQQNADGLKVQMPAQQPGKNALVFKIEGAV